MSLGKAPRGAWAEGSAAAEGADALGGGGNCVAAGGGGGAADDGGSEYCSWIDSGSDSTAKSGGYCPSADKVASIAS